MPAFFYTAVAATILSWIGVLFLGSEFLPDSLIHIFLFVFSLFIAIGLTITTAIFVFLNSRASLFLNKHVVFRKGLKIGIFTSAYVVGALLLRAFELGTVLNYLLYLILCVLLYKSYVN